MSRWDFAKEGTHPAAGANSVAGLEAGFQPYFEADNHASKRNVIATNVGWVRRQNYTDVHGNSRTKDEILVAANPGTSEGYVSADYLGFPDIAQLYVSTENSANSINVYVVFNEPVYFKGSANNLTITLANTAGGNSQVATANASIRDITNANNTVIFKVTGAQPGTYKIHANTIAVVAGSANLNSLNSGGEDANLVITGAVSNTLGTFTIS